MGETRRVGVVGAQRLQREPMEGGVPARVDGLDEGDASKLVAERHCVLLGDEHARREARLEVIGVLAGERREQAQ